MADFEILDVHIPCQGCGRLIPAGGENHCLSCRVWNLRLKETERKWIPVTERLPELDDIVLTWNGCDIGMHIWDNKMRKFVMLDSIGSTFLEVRFVTHWMPLPEPPQEEK